ncbi:DNA polymerase III subunit delta' [Ferrimonas balearica]|uniref:DNA polymerase III subunit delta' n=1 Tax=Ferrimonas balearica TaxID=44012 RepID=UPI001C946A1E|nr:DNA polymerase III subunit delta' [Ferrimonas balearica]MBY6223382.1 DNA polymerase III subunit delta' [Ferrimonas balearica]
MIEGYPWLLPVAEQWQQQRQQGRLGHALILQGPAGVGKSLLADWIVSRLLCLEGRGCGHCKGCQLLAAGHHPDRYELAPEGQQIKVDAVRGLISQLAGTAHQGGARVAIIHQAQRLNAASANALLKTLEEPPAGVYLVLVVGPGQPLLPTIVSRCQRLVVPMPSAAAIEQFLGEQGKALTSWSYWPRILGGPLAIRHAVEEGKLDQLATLRQGWQRSLNHGLLDPVLSQVDAEQAPTVLKVLYFELLSQCEADPQQTVWCYPMMQKVAQTQRWLDRQTGINLTATFQQLIVEYRRGAQEGA